MITLRLRHKHRVRVSSPVLQELSTVSLEDHTYRNFGFRALRPVNRRLLHLRAMHIEDRESTVSAYSYDASSGPRLGSPTVSTDIAVS